MSLRDDFAAPFERLAESEAAALLEQVYGIGPARLQRLDTERDDSFAVTTASGSFVLKVAHPDDDPLSVNLQSAALSYASELAPTLPLQRLLLSREGEVEVSVGVSTGSTRRGGSTRGGGSTRIARLLTWLPGVPLFERPPDRNGLETLGATLGRLTSALSSFDHPAAHRDFVWDAARLPLVADLRPAYPCAEIDAAFALFEANSALIAGLPQQVIHNDFHPGNVLVDEEDAVTGVLDFGDVVHTARVVDLAVALSYLRTPLGIADTTPFVEGFESAVRLTPEEHEALPILIAARLVERTLVNLTLARGNPDARDDAQHGAEANRAALAALLEEIG